MKPAERQLLELHARLGEAEQEMLRAFAEFLAARSTADEPRMEPPKEIPRPEQESVVGALKRLSASYHMLDKGKMLHETSALMAQHLMQGREATEVIDELEVVFLRHYERLQGKD